MAQWNLIKTSTAFYHTNTKKKKFYNVYETMKDPKQPKQSEERKTNLEALHIHSSK